MQTIRNLLIALRSSLWFVPGLMIIGSIVLALGLIDAESLVKREWLLKFPRIFGLGADGSRGMLTAIAGSMLTVAALAFSLTLTALTQASGQYSPRILRNFMRDRVNQFILGYFVSVFAYCLIVLRTIRSDDEMKFVPSLAVMGGLILALGGIIVLIFFIHHIASSLQISKIIASIVNETETSIEHLFPQDMGSGASESQQTEAQILRSFEYWHPIPALTSGYIQFVDTEELEAWAEQNDIIVKMERGIGQFVGARAGLVLVASKSEDLTKTFDEEKCREINKLFNIRRNRTIDQDVGFGIRQIVDIALKALSPGINDTTTAISCIDYLGVLVGKIARRELPEKVRVTQGEIRVIVKANDFDDYLRAAFDQIRINGKSNQAIFERLASALKHICDQTTSEDRRAMVMEQIRLIKEFAEETLQTGYERQRVKRKFEVLEMLN